MISNLSKILLVIASCASIGFGVWHFFVPAIWNWYSYIDSSATELVIAVRAINLFFSLCLVLFGAMNILLALGEKKSRYSLIIVLSASVILWITRVFMQLVFPQGSAAAILQYGMLLAFIAILAFHIVALMDVIIRKADQ